MDRFYVKFEKWDQALHATTKLIPSYGGWKRFRGIPLHAWKQSTFKQIREACGGSLVVAKDTRDKIDIIEANIKVHFNYTGFILATIIIIDDEGNRFLVHSIFHSEGRWLIERNPRIHGTFSREAVVLFDEFNPKA